MTTSPSTALWTRGTVLGYVLCNIPFDPAETRNLLLMTTSSDPSTQFLQARSSICSARALQDVERRFALTKNATSWIGSVRSIPQELALEREVTSRKKVNVDLLKTGEPSDLPPQPPGIPIFSWREKLVRKLSMSFSSSSLGGQERSKLQFLHATPSFEVENLTQRTEVEALANMLSAGTGIHFHLPVQMWRMWLLPVFIIFGIGGLLMLFVGLPTLDDRYDTSWNHVALLLCANLPTALCFLVAVIIVFLVGPTSLSWYYYLQYIAKVENGPPAWVLAVLAFLKCCGKNSIAIYDSHTCEQVKMKRSVRRLLQMLGGQDQDDPAGKPLVTIVAVDRGMLTPGGPKSMTLEEFEAKFKNAEGGVLLIVAVPSFEDILKEVPKSPLLDWMGSGIVVHNRDITDIFLDLDNAMRNNMGQFEQCIAAAPERKTV
ncbi:hypothetical protein CYMTET_25088 [Cymbomonas tetramitiformis]|uniref:Uncharacterized protein n=1 Tax=Cymbomonas tetramitiformis TaxID=36881 RepID=A0AAE0FUH0_9CHLO|nr:hypothetical protein CYMTET_25088 [Cymbomonas tetramitiformis]